MEQSVEEDDTAEEKLEPHELGEIPAGLKMIGNNNK